MAQDFEHQVDVFPRLKRVFEKGHFVVPAFGAVGIEGWGLFIVVD
jgi:hypothetical protein